MTVVESSFATARVVESTEMQFQTVGQNPRVVTSFRQKQSQLHILDLRTFRFDETVLIIRATQNENGSLKSIDLSEINGTDKEKAIRVSSILNTSYFGSVIQSNVSTIGELDMSSQQSYKNERAAMFCNLFPGLSIDNDSSVLTNIEGLQVFERLDHTAVLRPKSAEVVQEGLTPLVKVTFGLLDVVLPDENDRVIVYFDPLRSWSVVRSEASLKGEDSFRSRYTVTYAADAPTSFQPIEVKLENDITSGDLVFKKVYVSKLETAERTNTLKKIAT